jgi:hypothetical protein
VHERAAIEVDIEEGANEVISHGDGAEDLRGREQRVEKGATIEPGTAPSSPSSNREREEPPSIKTVWLPWKFHYRWRSCTTLRPSTVTHPSVTPSRAKLTSCSVPASENHTHVDL